LLPVTGTYFGSPVRQNQLGRHELTNTRGTLLPESFLPGTAARTSFQLSSFGSLLKLGGSFWTGCHEPLRSEAWSQDSLYRMYTRSSAVLEQVPVRVDGKLEIVVLDRAPDRLSIKVHERGERLAEEDRRRIRLHALDVLRHDLALIHVRQHAVQRDHPVLGGDAFHDLRHDLADLILGQAGEVRLGDGHVGESSPAGR